MTDLNAEWASQAARIHNSGGESLGAGLLGDPAGAVSAGAVDPDCSLLSLDSAADFGEAAGSGSSDRDVVAASGTVSSVSGRMTFAAGRKRSATSVYLPNSSTSLASDRDRLGGTARSEGRFREPPVARARVLDDP